MQAERDLPASRASRRTKRRLGAVSRARLGQLFVRATEDGPEDFSASSIECAVTAEERFNHLWSSRGRSGPGLIDRAAVKPKPFDERVERRDVWSARAPFDARQCRRTYSDLRSSRAEVQPPLLPCREQPCPDKWVIRFIHCYGRDTDVPSLAQRLSSCYVSLAIDMLQIRYVNRSVASA